MGTSAHHDADVIDNTIIDAAINWAVKLNFNTPSAATQAAFETWLHQQPTHAAAWQRITSLKADFAVLPSHLARNTLDAIEVRRSTKGLKRRQVIALLGLSGVIIGSGTVIQQQAPWQRLLADVSTKTGEQRTITLADGTTIILNTDTAISTRFDNDIREITLHRGEIAISTGKDSQFATRRPFWVNTPNGKLQAIGTYFTTRLDDRHTHVSVKEGAVALHPRSSVDSIIVNAGEYWQFDDRHISQISNAGIEPDSWTEGVIAGKNMRLGDLLTELSRYRSGRISIDPDIADLRVSGVYHIGDTDQVLHFLAQTQPVTVSYMTRFWVSVRAKHLSPG